MASAQMAAQSADFRKRAEAEYDGLMMGATDSFMGMADANARAMEMMQEHTAETTSFMQNAFSGWAVGFSSELTDMVWEWDMSIEKMLESLGRFTTQMAFQRSMTGLVNMLPFAKGGVITGPTIFPMANGMGLMGEAGAEAIMPLKRTSGGDLGVKAETSPVHVIINEAPPGTTVTEHQSGNVRQIMVNLSNAMERKYGLKPIGRRA
jgi:phage-related minor tail protein